jgi:hypothetical protein
MPEPNPPPLATSDALITVYWPDVTAGANTLEESAEVSSRSNACDLAWDSCATFCNNSLTSSFMAISPFVCLL